MTLRMPPLCHLCARLHLDGPWREPLTCDAFPAGIPRAILDRLADHRQPIAGDGGVLFKLNPKFTQADVADWGRHRDAAPFPIDPLDRDRPK